MTAHRRRTQLIVLTGIDGSGKSTQAQLLVANLQRRGFAADYVWARWEPRLLKPFVALAHKGCHSVPTSNSGGDSNREEQKYQRLSEFKRVILARSMVRISWLFLAVLDYAVQIHLRVRCRLRIGLDVLVTDRYLPDFIVDQSLNMRYTPEEISHFMASPLLRIFPIADLAFLIAISPEEGYHRKSDGTSLAYLVERTSVYDQFAKDGKMQVIDGMADKDQIAHVIIQQVDEFLT